VLITACLSLAEPDIPWLMDNDRRGLYLLLIASALVLALAVSRRGLSLEQRQKPLGKGRLSKRTMLAAVMILLAIPITIYIGMFYFGDRKYYFISLLILLETMLPFLLLFEGRKPQARELVILSVLCALGVAGRAAFFMLPAFKPVAALVIISAVAFGGEAGFLVGAASMLISNVMFGQGPWTPWQMVAMGMIGYLAGVLFGKGALRRSRLSLCIFGGLATLLLYGGLMNPATVLMYYDHPTWQMFLGAYLLGLPFDLIHAAATVIFLWLMAWPMLEKLDRIKVKYGLIE
jgi:energy-coupling factor transport system ATP-binding protein